MHRSTGAILLSVGLLLAAVQPAAAIVYGEADANPEEFPNVGAIVAVVEQDGVDSHFVICSGTLIKRGVFLTAAHCLPPGDEAFPDIFHISFSQDLDPGAGPEFLAIEGYVRHPEFNRRQSNPYDIGVVYFEDTTGLAPAEVATADLGALTKKQLRSAMFTAVGYGAVRQERVKGWQGITDNLERRQADQGALSLQKAWLTLSMNQATGDGGTCYGDSGGPHFRSGKVVSITVTGDAVCKATDKTYRLDTPWAKSFLDEALD